MKVCFFGSRGLKGEAIRSIIKRECEFLGVTHIITALEPAGVCEVAREYARAHCINSTFIPRQINKNAGMYHHRTVMCYELAEYVVLIHDGQSPGTQNEFDLALKMSMPLTYHCLQVKGVGTVQNKVNELGFKL